MLLRNADVIKSIGEFFRKTLEPCPALHGSCNGDQIGMLRCQLAEDLSEDLGIGRSFLLWNLPGLPRLPTEWNDAVKLGRVNLGRCGKPENVCSDRQGCEKRFKVLPKPVDHLPGH